MSRLLGIGAVLVALLAALPAALALADAGVGIDIGAITVNQRLSRGGTYELPTMGVFNPGDQPGDYVVKIQYFTGQSERQPGAGWFSFSPSSFKLEPGETQPVQMKLNVPTNARPADYRAMIEARIVPREGGATVGAGAGAPITFSVKPSNFLQAWQLKSTTWVGNHTPWTYLVPVMVALLVVAWFLRHRFEFNVQRRR